MCKMYVRQKERESRVFSIFENIAVSKHERTGAEKAETAECIRDIETT